MRLPRQPSEQSLRNLIVDFCCCVAYSSLQHQAAAQVSSCARIARHAPLLHTVPSAPPPRATAALPVQAPAMPTDQGCALLVTAHPDDETMFFAPLMLALLRRGLRVVLLCLSTGECGGMAVPRMTCLHWQPSFIQAISR